MRPSTKDKIFTGTFLAPFAFLSGGAAGVIMTGLLTAVIGANNEAKMKEYEENAKKFQYIPPTEKEREEKMKQIEAAVKKISEIIKTAPVIECRRLSYNRTQIDIDGTGIRKTYSYQMNYGEDWVDGSMLCFFGSDNFMKKVESSINQIEKTNHERIKRDGNQAELIKYNFYNIKGKDTRNHLLLFQYKLLGNTTCTIGLGLS